MIDDLVSIIMPAYNAEKYIAEAIESVLKQTYTNWELIIVNDCSTDATEQIIKKYILCSIIKVLPMLEIQQYKIQEADT